jgi:hypothetical protein
MAAFVALTLPAIVFFWISAQVAGQTKKPHQP